MPTKLILHRWWVIGTAGAKTKTRYLMTEADAKATDPGATPVPGTMEVREIPDDPATALSTSAWQTRGSPP